MPSKSESPVNRGKNGTGLYTVLNVIQEGLDFF